MSLIKLSFPELSAPIRIEEGYVYSLVIEEPLLYRRVIGDLYGQASGSDGFCILTDGVSPIPIAKNLDITTSLFPFELNRKPLLTKILSSLEKVAVNEDNFLRTSEIISQIERYIADITLELDCDFDCDKLSVAQLIKAVGIRIYDDGILSLAKVYNYMELVREFDRDRLFVFVDLRAYFPKREVLEFARTAISHRFRVLLLEPREYPRLECERRVVIDSDLCEIG